MKSPRTPPTAPPSAPNSPIQLDAALSDDPEQILSLPEIFFPLCRDYEIEPDPAKLSDEILGMDPIDYANDPYCMNPPPPRATSPP